MSEEKKKKKLIKKLKHKYRLVVLNDESFQEELSFVLSPLNLIVLAVSSILVVILITSFVILYTPVKNYLPGSSYEEVLGDLSDLKETADSLNYKIELNDQYYRNLEAIVNGEVPEDLTQEDSSKHVEGKISGPSDQDSVLRKIVEEADLYNTIDLEVSPGSPSSFSFFTPVNGMVIDKFDRKNNHLGTDIVAKEGSAIKSTLNGVVVFAEWTVETGHVIAIQHKENLLSIYKHNSVLLKKQGDIVKSGDPIAIIGNSGELSTGPHLHFELWFENSPINPEDYMNF